MSSLLETQRELAKLIMQPMTHREGMRTSNRSAAEKMIAPNDRLTGFERLEIYNRGYWFRVLDCLADDFPGVRAIIGAKRLRRMSEAYLAECPSRSFTLRNLGSRLGEWLKAHPQWMEGADQLVLDTFAIEWAHIEAFDAADLAPITPEELAAGGEDPILRLQPYISLLHVQYPVDDFSAAVRDNKRVGKMIATMRAAPPSDIYLAVHRVDFSVHYKRLEKEAFRLLSLLRDGQSLVNAFEVAFENSDRAEEEQAQSVESWFRLWQSLGWFSAVPIHHEQQPAC
jgi:hypothetical protein